MTFFSRRNAKTALDSPQLAHRRTARVPVDGAAAPSGNEVFGRWTESIARGMGTPWFLLALTLFCVAWLFWNTAAPENQRFDSAALGFTALTLILSLQASYAAPMILLAQNRQDDRDHVQIVQDRQRVERNLADTEFLAREVVALRLAMKDLPDRDFVRTELRAMLNELLNEAEETSADAMPVNGSAAEAALTGDSIPEDNPDVGPNPDSDSHTEFDPDSDRDELP